MDDVQEVSNYVAALLEGIKLLDKGLRLSLRLVRQVHSVLLGKGRGSSKTPGVFRRSQNWIGGTRPGNAVFVPPPPEAVMDCMATLELFLHDKPEATPPLIKAALAHVQFETIHPFLDGNGRLGRLLITLILCEQKVLAQPLLYLSLYFKTHRAEYYRLLTKVREEGDWEEWLAFFAEAVTITSQQGVDTAKKLHRIVAADHEKIKTLGRVVPSVLSVYKILLSHPIATPKKLSEVSGLTPATVNKSLKHLDKLNIVEEMTAQKRNRLYSYSKYIEIMNSGIDI